MPEILTREEFQFLAEVDRLGSEGVPLMEIARRHNIAPSTISHRVNRRGFATTTQTRIVDRRTGRTLEQLVSEGEIVIAEEPAAVPA